MFVIALLLHSTATVVAATMGWDTIKLNDGDIEVLLNTTGLLANRLL